MGENHKSGSAWRFTIRVVLPVILAVGITIAAVAGFVYWSITKSDDRALQRETHLVNRVIEQKMKALREQQAYYSSWDQAIEALSTGDMAWIDANLASELFSNGQFDRIYVLDPTLAPLYAMYAGGKTNADRFEADRAVVAPMVERLKAVNAAGALAAFDSGNSASVPAIAEINKIDGRPAYVGVTAIMSESRDEGMEQLPGEESFLVGVRFLAGAIGMELAEQYFVEGPSFGTTASTEPGVASVALTNEAGQTVGWLNWRPDRPGAMILSETLPAMIGALTISGIVLVLLLRGLRRTTAALEDGKAEAEHLANHDTLTGLANRAFFSKRLEEAINGGKHGGEKNGGEENVALLALDLDRFKQVNDTLGHEAGDQLLREVARRLLSLVADDDTVARLGGDEFAIIRRHVRTAGDVSVLSDRIIAELGAPFMLAGRAAQIGVSIGVVITPANRAPRDLTSKADMALYEAKAAGRNTFRIFDEAAQFRGQIDQEMRTSNLPVKLDRVA